MLSERLFVEGELPFFMLDTRQYPTTTQGKISDRFDRQKNFSFYFQGDSITIVRQLFNKYSSSLAKIRLERDFSRKTISFRRHFK